MQFKILALAALSVNSAQAGLVKRASVSNGAIIFPEVVFNPNEYADPGYRALQIMTSDIVKTAIIVSELTRQTGTTAIDRADQANAIVRQATANCNAIRTRVGTIVGALLTLGQGTATTATSNAGGVVPSATAAVPAPPTVDAPDVGALAEALVRAAQTLARNVTEQLNTLDTFKNQAVRLTDIAGQAGKVALQVAATNANIGLGIVLSTINGTANTLLTTVANTAATVTGTTDATVGRVRNAQLKVGPSLQVGAQPELVF